MTSEQTVTNFGSVVEFVTHRVKVSDVPAGRYVSTDSMITNCGGLSKEKSRPPAHSTVIKYKRGDTLFSNIRTYFRKVWLADTDGGASPDVLVFRSKDNSRLNPTFLYYVVSNPDFVEFTDRTSQGAKMPRGSKAAIAGYELHLPDLSEQNEIARLLSSLDDRITLLRETNQTLETIAQAIFKSWFVDFDPVRAKMEGRQPVGMDEETAALFPDELVESELGLIPKGWELGCIADLGCLNPESWTARTKPKRLIYVDLANAKENSIGETVEYDYDDAPSRARRVLRSGDTIIGTVRPGNRSFAFIWEPIPNLTASTGFAVLRPRRDEYTEYVYLAVTQDTSIDTLAHLADGAAYPAVRPEQVSNLACVIPDLAVMTVFHAVAGNLMQSISFSQNRRQLLSSLRDTLLPRLISGKLRVPVDETDAVTNEE